MSQKPTNDELVHKIQVLKDRLQAKAGDRDAPVPDPNPTAGQPHTRNSPQMLQQVIDSLPHSIFWKDRDLVYLGCNANFARNAGVGHPDEIRGKTDYDLAWKREEAQFFRKCDREVIESGTPDYHIVEPQQQAGNRQAWLDTSKIPLHDPDGKVIGILGIFEDITERKTAEETALAQAERFKVFFSSVNDAIMVHPLQEEGFAPFIEVNAIACERYGYTREEFLQLSAPDITVKSYAEEHSRRGHRNELLTRGRLVFEAVHIKKSGKTFPVEINSNIVRQSGRPLILTVVRDISDRKRAETERRELEQNLAQAQKMQAIGTLAGGIAHDFNNILAGMLGYTELARRNVQTQPATLEMLDQVMKAGQRAADLVKQILSFSRSQQNEPQPVSPKTTIHEALKLIRASLPKNIDIRPALHSQSRVMADPTNIHQVIMNLCTNAAHAMQASGGVLTVGLTDVTLAEPDLAHRPNVAPGDFVKISVEDTGIGMTPAVQKMAFDPFFTTKELGQGTGMGLSTVHGIITELGGFISLYSEPGRGTAVHLFIPFLSGSDRAETATDAEPVKGGTERILFIDDEQMQVDLARETLPEYGYQVTAFPDSEIALMHFQQNPSAYDLVITDMTMPKITGDILTQKIHLERPDIPVIMCTGFSDTIDAQKARALDIKAFLYKPVVLADMLATVRQVLDDQA